MPQRLLSARLTLLRIVGSRHASTSASPVVHQLQRINELSSRVASENSKTVKAQIIAEYPDLRELLEHVYDPNYRAHLSSKSLLTFLNTKAEKAGSFSIGVNTPESISDLFETLSSRAVTGNAAKHLCAAFLAEHGVTGPILETFYRLLDRNLVAGFGARTLSSVPWDGESIGISTPNSSTTRTPVTPTPPSSTPAPSARPSKPVRTLTAFSAALGKSLDPPFSSIFKPPAPPWWASRKLDGVRVISLLDFFVPSDPSSAPEFDNASFVSRSGNPFHSLDRLGEQLEAIAQWPGLRDWLDGEQIVLEERDGGQVKRLVLDGEVCLMRPISSAPLHADQKADDGALGSVPPGLIEDFPSTVSAVRTQATMRHLNYFIFDMLTHSELQSGSGSRLFSERCEVGKGFVQWLDGELGRRGVEERFPRWMEQVLVTQPEEVEEMMGRASKEGWEGLILRADKPYVGKRSMDVRKVKHWQDAEFVVKSLDTGRMRLAVDGVFGEHEACANVWIEYEGHPVSIGSGFSNEQRIRYAQHPDQIIGKQITVQYFSESESVDRPGVKSLRFPRVKQVWEDGKRDI